MAISRKEAARALSADEQELVEKSHHPAVQELSDADLAGLVKLCGSGATRRRPKHTAAGVRYAARERRKAPRPQSPMAVRRQSLRCWP